MSKSKSYYGVSSKVKNIKLLKAKLELFMLLASELEPFLKKFQSNKPMVPYLYPRLHSLMMMLLNRFVKPSVLEGVNTPNQLIKLELRKQTNLMMVKEIDIGFGARRALTDK